MDEKVAPVRGPSRRGNRQNGEPALVITPPPVLPPTNEELLEPFYPASRKQRVLLWLRYYGFVGGLVALILIVVALTVMVLTDSPEPEPELSAADIAELQARRRITPLSSARNSPVAEPVSVSITTTPAGAAVRLDGEEIGPSPIADLQLRPGYYLLSVSHPSFLARDTLLEITQEAQQFVALALGNSGPGSREAATDLPVAASPRERQPERAASAPTRENPPARQAEVTPPPPARQPVARAGALAIVTEPQDARIILDGRPVGSAPLLLSDVTVGEHEVLVHAPGYVAASQMVTIEQGQQATLRLSLQALEGTLSVLVRPWGSIYVNGSLVKRDTDVLYTASMSTGYHTVRVVHPVLGQQEQTVEVRPGLTTRVVFELGSN